MRKYLLAIVLLMLVATSGVVYGIAIHRNQVFPFSLIRDTYRDHQLRIQPYGPWAIGIYEGMTPFDLQPAKDIANPVLTGEHVTDIEAAFVADPFMLVEDDKYYAFFEILNRQSNHGDIGYAESVDGKHWQYKKVVVDEEFHLSYPYVFTWEGDYYLIPETKTDYSVRLYKARAFPECWEYVGDLLAGYQYGDPTIFRHNDKWWLFASPDNGVLNLHYSDSLNGHWLPHPMNPIVKCNSHIARPGGRVITVDGQLYRFTQDDEPEYGIRVHAFEITKLTETEYSEQPASDKPVVDRAGVGWNAAGMHHVDAHQVGDRWIAIVDGRDQ